MNYALRHHNNTIIKGRGFEDDSGISNYTLSRQNSSCMARYWVQVCCESRVYDDCGSGGQEMCLLMLQTVATETNVSGSGAAVIELST